MNMKISRIMKGEVFKAKKEYYKNHDHHFLNKKRTDECKEKISESVKKLWMDENYSKNQIKVMNDAKKYVECPHCNKIVCFNNCKIWHFDNCISNPLNVNKVRKSVKKDPHKSVPEEVKFKISNTLKNKLKTRCIHCGLETTNENLINRWHNENCKLVNKNRGLEYKTNARAVVQLDFDMNFIMEFKSGRSAALFLNISSSNIFKCCKDRRYSHGGFKWMYKEDWDKLNTDKNDKI